jgi:transposase
MREDRMGRFIEGADRRQATLLPDTIEDYVGEENPVRVTDAFVEMCDLVTLGFEGVIPEETGRPSYLRRRSSRSTFTATSTRCSPDPCDAPGLAY